MQIDLPAMVRRTGKTRRPYYIAREITPTAAHERQLRTIYGKVVTGWSAAWERSIRPVYERTLGEGMRDSVDDVEGVTDEMARAMTRLTVALGPDLENWIVQVEKWHRGKFGQLFTPVGVKLDTLLTAADVRPTLKAVMGENISLIRSLDDQMRNGISGAVFRGLTNRTPAREVAREIRRVTDIGKRRAELIAADQLQKLTSRLDQERQEQVGIDRFQWAHSRKKYPRPEHVARDGKIYAWDSTVAKNDPPGRAIRCGCRSRPVLELEADAAPDETTSSAPAATREPTLAQRNDAADKAAREYVLRHGREQGVEHLVSIDQRTGEAFERKSGDRNSVTFTPYLQDRLRDPAERIMLHHNHPSSSAFSDADIDVAHLPGVVGIWAHGHDGSEYYARVDKKKPIAKSHRRAVVNAVYERVNALLQGRVIEIETAQQMHNHLVWRALADQGVIEYRYVLRGRQLEIYEANKTLMDLIVGAIAK